jgi:hypothetical protein
MPRAEGNLQGVVIDLTVPHTLVLLLAILLVLLIPIDKVIANNDILDK